MIIHLNKIPFENHETVLVEKYKLRKTSNDNKQ